MSPESRKVKAPSSAGGEYPADRGQAASLFDQAGRLVGDDARALTPPLRLWWSPEPGSPWTEADILTFWCVSVPMTDTDAHATYAEAVKRTRPAIDAALQAARGVEAAEAALEREHANL